MCGVDRRHRPRTLHVAAPSQARRYTVSQLHESRPVVVNGLIPQVPDNDPQETAEWVESLSGLINEKGGPRARYILLHMLSEARRNGV